MFDVNPDAMKHYLKDIERQVAAARRHQGTPRPLAGGRGGRTGADGGIARFGRQAGQGIAAAVRGLVAVIM